MTAAASTRSVKTASTTFSGSSPSSSLRPVLGPPKGGASASKRRLTNRLPPARFGRNLRERREPMPDDVLTRPPSTVPTSASSQEAADARDLGRFGYKQELRRVLGVYSSFAVAFSYISPSTGIFTLFAPIGLAIAGPFFFWSWPLVALGQFIIALNFAEVSSHFPVAGSVYQWTKYLSNRPYSWMTGWIYLFAGVITVTAVVATIPGLVLIPLLNNLGMTITNNAQTQVAIALVILAS